MLADSSLHVIEISMGRRDSRVVTYKLLGKIGPQRGHLEPLL